MRIHLLDPLIANQIAAGEVIERPASVIKELLENSLDAGADKIELEILNGGLKQIRIRDNGCGIYKEDLALAVTRHGTSKISLLDDLEKISTLGFRGEALASLAAVSHLTLISCPLDQDNAWQLKISGIGQQIQISPTPHPKGTTVEVYDLFFNVPARRKFMRSEKTEFLAIQEIVKRIALSHFETKFILHHNQRIIYSLPAAETVLQQEQRLMKLFGKAFLQHAFKIDSAAGSMRLWGWAATSNYHRAQGDQQYFYINKRAVRDKLIQHAIRQVYYEFLAPNRHPAYVLFLEIDPEMVDVNVHPTKHEVRFRQARLAHDFIVHALKQILFEHNNFFSTSVVPRLERGTEISGPNWIPRSSRGTTEVLVGTTEFGILFSNYVLMKQDEEVLIVDIRLVMKNLITSLEKNSLNKINNKPFLIPKRIKINSQKTHHLDILLSLANQLNLTLVYESSQLILKSIPEIFADIDWTQSIEKFFLEKQPELDILVEILSQHYKFQQDDSSQRFFLMWNLLNSKAQHKVSHILKEAEILKLFECKTIAQNS